MWMYLETSIAVILLFQSENSKKPLLEKVQFAKEFSGIST